MAARIAHLVAQREHALTALHVGRVAEAIAVLEVDAPANTPQGPARGEVQPWPDNPSTSLLDNLPDRIREAAVLACEGLSIQQIADRMFVSRSTAKRHIEVALAKTGSRNRVELAGRLHKTSPSDTP